MSDYAIPAPEPDEYWQRRCTGCSDTGNTNLECVTQVAANIGISVDEAMRQFGPPPTGVDVSTEWSQGEWKPSVDE